MDPRGRPLHLREGALSGKTKRGGPHGWADVWKRGYFAFEYKGRHKDLDAAYRKLDGPPDRECGAAPRAPRRRAGKARDRGIAVTMSQGAHAAGPDGSAAECSRTPDRADPYRAALENPPLLVTCDMDRIVVHTNFTATKQEIHELPLDALGEPWNRTRVCLIPLDGVKST